jgi:CRP/FNR family cyclic AMP-dependent transcriptional regulator
MEKSADREVIFKDYQARDFFGGVSVIHGKPRKAGILALTDVAVTRMPGAVFRELLHSVPDLCDQFLLRMAGEIQHLVNRVNEFSTLDVRHRIYAELLRLSRPKAGTEHGAVISPPPRQVDVAARIGTRREPVAREMKVLERAGLLRRSRGALEIVDTRRLQSLLDMVEPHL